MTTIKDLREKANMTRQQFCDYFGIPYRTLQDWELGSRKCPEYVYKLIEYKLIKEGFIN
jgi:DNA-binding transcriptional regulator YiaG